MYNMFVSTIKRFQSNMLFEDLKAKPLPPNTFPVSIDVVGIYSNIPHKEAVDTMREALNSREDQSIPTAFLIMLLLQVLQYNVYNFGVRLVTSKTTETQCVQFTLIQEDIQIFPNPFMFATLSVVKSSKSERSLFEDLYFK